MTVTIVEGIEMIAMIVIEIVDIGEAVVMIATEDHVEIGTDQEVEIDLIVEVEDHIVEIEDLPAKIADPIVGTAGQPAKIAGHIVGIAGLQGIQIVQTDDLVAKKDPEAMIGGLRIKIDILQIKTVYLQAKMEVFLVFLALQI